MKIEYYILSLVRTDRQRIIVKNLKRFPEIKIFRSVNGYNIQETLTEFKQTGLKYHQLEFPTYGTLANFITKYKMLCYQITNKIPVLCFIEDDLRLYKSFMSYIRQHLFYFNDDLNLNMLRLGTWGEGYVTTFNGAKRIKNIIDEKGICSNIDNQLRSMCGREIHLPNTPWVLKIGTNQGDCLKTSKITDLSKLS